MDYFSILELNREPFSNSPDPEFFFQSGQHQSCLQRLELALRLKRGLNVVIGDVGTGKTTLCRQLIRKFSDDPDIETHLILDPDFSSPVDLLQRVTSMFEGAEPTAEADPWQLKERIKQALFRKGVDEKKTVALIIDEGQKIPDSCLEPLREFLNYETNEHKLLQIAIFAQPEFEKTLTARPNFADRINLKHTLGPMGFRDTREMIRYRLRRSSDAGRRENLFTMAGLWAVYRATGGYPRKIVHLCHQCLLAVIIQNRSRAGWSLVRSCAKRATAAGRVFGLRPGLTALLVVLIVGGIAALPPIQALWLPERPSPARNTESSPPEARTASSSPTGGFPTAEPEAEKLPAAGSAPAPPAMIDQAAPAASATPAASAAPAAAATAAVDENTRPLSAATAGIGSTDATGGPPAFLGSVVLQNRETLWRLVGKVYGEYDPSYLRSIREANPQIRNPKKVEVGSTVRVPAIPASVEPSPGSSWWVRFDEKDLLEEAIEAYRRHPDAMPPIRILPYWQPSKGLAFSLLLKERFTDEAAARLEIERLKTASGIDAALVSGWAPETVFYANPYKGG